MSGASQDDGEAAGAPRIAEIEERFRSPVVRLGRPVILGGIRVLRVVRRFGWSGDGAETLPDHEPFILAANHCSHADTAAILGTLPRSVRHRTCVAAALDVFGPPSSRERHTLKAFRRECLQIVVAAGFHAFAFDRHGPPRRSIRTAVELVRGGWNLLLYPEGTRSRTGKMGRFKAGVGVLARTTGRRVIPVHVSGGTTILPCGAFLPRPGHALVRYGAPLTLDRGESGRDFTERLSQAIGELAPGGIALDTRESTELPPAPTRLAPIRHASVGKQSA